MKNYSKFPKDTAASPSDCLMSYSGHSLKEGVLRLVYSTAPAEWVHIFLFNKIAEKLGNFLTITLVSSYFLDRGIIL